MSLSGRVKVGVACVVTRIDTETGQALVLMGKRRGAHAPGTLEFPGGKTDPGEGPEDAAIRELLEETNLVATDAVAAGFWSYDVFPEDDLHYITLYYHMAVEDFGTLKLMEPLKCEGWEWYDPYAHPQDDYALPRDVELFSGVNQAIGRII